MLCFTLGAFFGSQLFLFFFLNIRISQNPYFVRGKVDCLALGAFDYKRYASLVALPAGCRLFDDLIGNDKKRRQEYYDYNSTDD